MWDLHAGRLARKFTGQKQGNHLIRSGFGGDDDSFVLSGSEGMSNAMNSHHFLTAGRRKRLHLASRYWRAA